MDLHKEFLEFTQVALTSDLLDLDCGPDLHALLAPIADGDELYELLGSVPDDRIGEVLGWALGLGVETD